MSRPGVLRAIGVCGLTPLIFTGCLKQAPTTSPPEQVPVDNPVYAGLERLNDLVPPETEASPESAPAPIDPARSRADLELLPRQVSVDWSGFATLRGLTAVSQEIPIDLPAEATAEARARAFIDEHGMLFGLPDSRSLELEPSTAAAAGSRTVTFGQRLAELPVWNARLAVGLGPGGGVSWATATLAPSATADSSSPQGSADWAATAAGGDAAQTLLGWYVDDPGAGSRAAVHLAWRVPVSGSGQELVVYVADADGRVLASASTVDSDFPGQHQEVFKCDGCAISTLPGLLELDDQCHFPSVIPPRPPETCVSPRLQCADLSRGPCLPVGDVDPQAEGVSKLLGFLEDHLYTAFGRVGWRNTPGHPLDRTRVTISSAAGGDCHALWRRKDAATAPATLILGPERASCVDVLAHEYAHAIADSRDLFGELGNCSEEQTASEALADVFGELMEEPITGGVDWRHGTHCAADACPPREAPRNSNLANPRAYWAWCRGNETRHPSCSPRRDFPFQAQQPADYTGYRMECGGHWNSTIVSRIGHLLGREPTEGAVTVGGLPVTGVGVEKAGRFWYELLTENLRPDPDLPALFGTLVGSCIQAGYMTSDERLNCVRAVSATGLWTSAYPSRFRAHRNHRGTPLAVAYKPEADRAVHVVRNRPAPGRTDDPPLGDLFYSWRRCDNCPVIGEENIYGGVPHHGFGAAVLPGGTAIGSGPALVLCFHHRGGYPYCIQRSDSGWTSGGPIVFDRSPITGSISVARLGDKLFMAYRSRGEIRWRSLETGATYWSDEHDSGIASTIDPVLASSVDDPMAEGDDALWMAYVTQRTGKLTVQRFNPGRGEWTGGSTIPYNELREIRVPPGAPDPPPIFATTRLQPAMTFFRGRLHLAVNSLGWGEPGEVGTLHYGSCAMPCAREDWTDFVQLPFGAAPGVTLWPSPYSLGKLWLWSRPTGEELLEARLKFSS